MTLTKRTKRLLIAGALVLGLPVGAILLLAQNSARYPGAGVTTGDLFIASNYATTTLLTQISATATSATVASGSGFVAPQLVSIDSEIVSVCQVSGNTLTFGRSACPNADGRGYDGSVAVSHIASRPVEGRVVAWLHNQLAAEVIAIEMRPAGKFYAPAYVSLASAVSAAGSSGTVVAPAGYTANVATPVVVPDGVSIELAGATVKAAANIPVFQVRGTSQNHFIDGSGGGVIDGQWSQNPSWRADCVDVGGSHIAIRHLTIRNCSNTAVFVTGTAGNTVGYHDEISNNDIYGNFNGGILSQNNVSGLMVLSNHVDNSASNISSNIAVHSFIDGDSQTDIAIKGNNLTGITGNFGIEVGNFCQHGFGACSTPSNVVAEGNTGELKASPAPGSTLCGFAVCGGMISFAGNGVNNGSITGNVLDDKGLTHQIAFVEAAMCNHCTVTGNSEINPNNADPKCCTGITVNASSWTTVTGNVFQGGASIYSAVPPGNTFPAPPASNNVISGNVFIAPAMLTISPVNAMVQIVCNDVACNASNNIVADNVIIGNGGLVKTALGVFNYGSAGNLADSNVLHDNTLINFTYSFNSNGTVSTNTRYHDNTCVAVTNCNNANRPPGSGPVPTVTLMGAGAGGGATYHICNGPLTAFNGTATVADANCGLAATPYTGLVIIIGGTGAGTGQVVFQLTVPAFAFDQATSCLTTTIASNSVATTFSSIGGNTATQFSFFNFSPALVSGITYQVAYYCPPN